MSKDESGLGIGWFLAGTAVGIAIAMLYAPKSGRDTRGAIAQKASAGKETVSHTAQDIVERGREMYEKGRQIADEAALLFERGRRLVRGDAAPAGEQA